MRGRPRLHRVLRITAWTLGIAAVVVLGASVFVERRYADRIVPVEQAPSAPVALIYGAGLARQKKPSPVLAQRLDAAFTLFRAGKVQKLLLSGDNSDPYHDETEAMRRYAVAQGIPESALLSDDLGLSTYESSARAYRVFGVRQAILVTQAFHLPRALYLANSMGIDAYGVAADGQNADRSRYQLRELFSRALAFAMVHLRPRAEADSAVATPGAPVGDAK
jgi:vancomycin permeability regulator SanA